MLLPWPERGAVAVRPPAAGPGYWAGAPCAVAGDGEVFLAYRLRRPVGRGRGYAVMVARSADGERFETLLSIGKHELATESLERPALVRTPEGRWRTRAGRSSDSVASSCLPMLSSVSNLDRKSVV